MAHPTSSAWKIIPQFQSLSITRTLNFYTTELGFQTGGVHPENSSNPTFCSLFVGPKAEANIYFRLREAGDFHAGSAWIALGTAELDTFYEKVKEEGRVTIVEKLEDKEWGYRQFAVKDDDGNVLTSFKFLEGGNPGTE